MIKIMMKEQSIKENIYSWGEFQNCSIKIRTTSPVAIFQSVS